MVSCGDKKPDKKQADPFEATHFKVFAEQGGTGGQMKTAFTRALKRTSKCD